MNNTVLIILICFLTFISCKKDPQPEDNTPENKPSLSNRWRLMGTLPDTATQFNWSFISYNKLNSIPGEYYCVPTPNISPYFGKNYFSPYKCTVVENNIYYFLPDAYCNRNLQPFIIDSPWVHTTKNDFILNTDSSFRSEYVYEQSKWIKWFTSTCTSIQYFPAVKKDNGYTGNWSFNVGTNVLTIDYKSTYGVTANSNFDVIAFQDNSLPKTEKWKIHNLNDSTVILNSCITCDVNNGFRRLYKKQ